MNWRIVALMGILLISVFSSQAQETLDKIVAVVGDKIILKSEIDNALLEMSKDIPEGGEDQFRCDMMQQFLIQKVMIEQAERDSVIVSDDEIEGQLNNRIRYFVSQFGSEEKLEEMAGKSVYQLKDEYRQMFRDRLTSDRMQQSILSNVKITPIEVKSFYDKIPSDSLPFFPSMLEVGQIVFKPNVNKEVEAYAIAKLEEIRADIISGKVSFDIMAGIHSQDPGSKDNGGDLGVQGRDDLVPEFAAAAFRLQNGEISPIVKTKFGFHIVQMVNRQGEKAELRHILIKPLITADMVKETLSKADSVRANLIAGKMRFSEAVAKYTTDDQTKITGGMFTDPQTNGSMVTPDLLDPSVALLTHDMKPGEFSKPEEFTDPQTGDRLVRIIYLKNRTEPHRANLREDYSRIQMVALEQKKTDVLQKWIKDKLANFYIQIDDTFSNCENLDSFRKTSTAKKP